MSDLRTVLERLGLGEYTDTFITEGFDTWQTLSDITESDLNDLNVKLGHRRKLQRAILDSRGPDSKASNGVESNGSARSEDSPDSPTSRNGGGSNMQTGQNSPSSNSGFRAKRKYRRHPKTDPNAPERPASAYVRFSNRMRQELADQELSFIEMAKVVGDRWQALPSQEREWYENQAATAKEKYNAEMSRYKRTEDYARYQEYLADFKSKTGNSNSGSASESNVKRTKTDSDSPLEDHGRRASIISAHPSDTYSIHDNASYASTSPHIHTLPSPRHLHSEISNGFKATNSPSTHLPPTRAPLHEYHLLPSHQMVSHSRTSSMTRPPPLDSSNSSRSASSRSPLSHSIPSLSTEASDRSSTSMGTPDPSSRVLPPPMPIPGRNHYGAAPRLGPSKSDVDLNDPRQSGSLAALLRAGELVAARDSDNALNGSPFTHLP